MERFEGTFSEGPDESPPPRNGRGAAARRPTMREVAAVAGVSLATVSRVVNGDANVRADLVEKVRDAVALLGYRRDLTATTLRRADRQSASIGLIFEDVANPFLAAVHRAIEDVARARGVLVFAASSDEDPERERELAQALLSRRVDGLIVVPAGGDQSYLLPERDAGVAIVFLDRPPAFLDADCALSDNFGGAEAATGHLLAAGHTRIGFLGDRAQLHTSVERLRGYRAALAAHALAEDPALVRLDLSDSRQAHEAAGELLDAGDPPTALFTSQNLITLGGVDALRSRGLLGRVALVGFDDLPLAEALEPGLTVVAQDVAGLGRAAAELLFARLDGDGEPSKRVVLPTRLIARGSGEVRP